MTDVFRFKCKTCDEWHEGMPALAADAPLYYYSIPPEEREERCSLDSDFCFIDDEFFFVRSNILVPVHGLDQDFIWGVWVSLSRDSMAEYLDHYDAPDRAGLGPYFGWLSLELSVYPPSETLKTRVHIQPPEIRPRVELQPSDHLLAQEQLNGISQDRLAEIYSTYLH